MTRSNRLTVLVLAPLAMSFACRDRDSSVHDNMLVQRPHEDMLAIGAGAFRGSTLRCTRDGVVGATDDDRRMPTIVQSTAAFTIDRTTVSCAQLAACVWAGACASDAIEQCLPNFAVVH